MTKVMVGVMLGLLALGLMTPAEGISALESDVALLAAAARAQRLLAEHPLASRIM